MPYVQQVDITAEIDIKDLGNMLDDAGDGADVDTNGNFTGATLANLNTVIAVASREVDGRVASIYTTPFADPAPAKVRAAALVFTCEALYARRLVPDEKNPFKSRADAWRKELTMVGHGELELDATISRAFTPGSFSADRMLIGNLM